ncbi:hypothetical protein ACDQ55_19390 [Chitinophaga sp. 30R24]|uniref:hypothetical protein n=1 Tax=Chitinophaga sp. 30R24 TaxID=3248838 RepID=UPI003B905C79
MKKVLLLMLLIGGTALTTYAQRGYYGHGHGWDRRDYRRCYAPPVRRVVYVRPAYYPVVPVPAVVPVAAVVPVPVPAPVPRYYGPRPRAVFHAGVTIVN